MSVEALVSNKNFEKLLTMNYTVLLSVVMEHCMLVFIVGSSL